MRLVPVTDDTPDWRPLEKGREIMACGRLYGSLRANADALEGALKSGLVRVRGYRDHGMALEAMGEALRGAVTIRVNDLRNEVTAITGGFPAMKTAVTFREVEIDAISLADYATAYVLPALAIVSVATVVEPETPARVPTGRPSQADAMCEALDAFHADGREFFSHKEAWRAAAEYRGIANPESTMGWSYKTFS
jgi:hypothetical protein